MIFSWFSSMADRESMGVPDRWCRPCDPARRSFDSWTSAPGWGWPSRCRGWWSSRRCRRDTRSSWPSRRPSGRPGRSWSCATWSACGRWAARCGSRADCRACTRCPRWSAPSTSCRAAGTRGASSTGPATPDKPDISFRVFLILLTHTTFTLWECFPNGRCSG